MHFVQINRTLCSGTRITVVPLVGTCTDVRHWYQRAYFNTVWVTGTKIDSALTDHILMRCGIHKAHFDKVKSQESTLRLRTTWHTGWTQCLDAKNSWRNTLTSKPSSGRTGGCQILLGFVHNSPFEDFKLKYTGCSRRNVPDFGRVFLTLKYTDVTQNTYVQNWTVTEIRAREAWNFDSCYTLTDYQIHIETGRNMWFL